MGVRTSKCEWYYYSWSDVRPHVRACAFTVTCTRVRRANRHAARANEEGPLRPANPAPLTRRFRIKSGFLITGGYTFFFFLFLFLVSSERNERKDELGRARPGGKHSGCQTRWGDLIFFLFYFFIKIQLYMLLVPKYQKMVVSILRVLSV